MSPVQDLLLPCLAFACVITMTPKRILIADDSNIARGVLAKFFAQRDFDVCEAVDGEDTIEKARKLKPDLILLDVAMPHTNGIAAASVLKDMLPNVRIVLFTMYTEAIAEHSLTESLPLTQLSVKGTAWRNWKSALKTCCVHSNRGPTTNPRRGQLPEMVCSTGLRLYFSGREVDTSFDRRH